MDQPIRPLGGRSSRISQGLLLRVRVRAAIAKLHRRLDAGEMSEVGDLKTAISTLQLEFSVLKSIATWPWQPETVRWLITALVLPLGLWLLQFILQRLMTN